MAHLIRGDAAAPQHRRNTLPIAGRDGRPVVGRRRNWWPPPAPRRRSSRRGPGPRPSSSSMTPPAPSPSTMPRAIAVEGAAEPRPDRRRRWPLPLAGGMDDFHRVQPRAGGADEHRVGAAAEDDLEGLAQGHVGRRLAHASASCSARAGRCRSPGGWPACWADTSTATAATSWACPRRPSGRIGTCRLHRGIAGCPR